MPLSEILNEEAVYQVPVDSLKRYRDETGKPPVSTAILFEPYHRGWGIYHSSQLMHRDDSPGDYEVHNSGTGEMQASAIEQSREDTVEALSALGESLVARIDVQLLPSGLLSFSLDYDEVWRWPEHPNTQ